MPIDDSSGPADTAGKVAARLRAGALQVDEALEILIEDALERELARADRPAELAPRLRQLLRGYALADPRLADKIRHLMLVT